MSLLCPAGHNRATPMHLLPLRAARAAHGAATRTVWAG